MMIKNLGCVVIEKRVDDILAAVARCNIERSLSVEHVIGKTDLINDNQTPRGLRPCSRRARL